LLSEFAGKVDLIYIDPPFDTGADFSYTAVIPTIDDGTEPTSFRKQPSIIEQKAYRDTWARGLDSYIGWLADALMLLKELLSSKGSLFLHLGVNVASYARPLLDEVFGPDCYTNEIVWKRSSAHSDIGQGAEHLGRVHDVIYWYRASDAATVNMQYEPYSEEYIKSAYKHIEANTGRQYRIDNTSGPGGARKGNPFYEFRGVKKYWRYSPETLKRLYSEGRIVRTSSGGDWGYKRYLNEMQGVPIQDVWLDIAPLQSQSSERLGYDTQKPEKLLERIVKLASNEDDLVMDCFCGSGTTAAVAERLNRRWITCDLGRFSVHTARKRLLRIPRVKPFVVQNLGKYERQAWQSAEFASGNGDQLEEQRLREKRYRQFILDLYHATPVTGHAWLHGLKAGRMVHVGAVDAPVTLSDIRSIAREVWKASNSSGEVRKAAADILGWEFAFELNETARQIAAESRVDVAFKKIPREVLEKKAVEQGDIKFFELGALSVDTKLRKRELLIELTDFVIPIDDVPEDVRKVIKHWSQMIDYWAVDWDFKDDTFHNQWQSYRTLQEPKLDLSARYEYGEPGQYKVLVKVIDILGNDTTKTLDIKVK
jgi:DNA modification methylase